MHPSTNQGCSVLVLKVPAHICSDLNSFETTSPPHLQNIYDKNEKEKKEIQKNETIASSDISTSYKNEQKSTMGNQGLNAKSKKMNYTELTDEQIESLVLSTKFSLQQIREWHESFLTDCPTGKLNRKHFVEIYRRFYTQGNADDFCSLAFNALDRDKNGFIDFSEFLTAIALTMSDELQDRLNLAFSMYDINGDGFLDKKELTQVIKLIAELNGKKYIKEQMTSQEKACMVIDKLDTDGDRKLSRQEFVSGCLNDSQIRKLLTP